MTNESKVTCPKCGVEINVSDILYHQIQDQLTKENQEQNEKKEKEYQEKVKALQTESDKIQKQKEEIKDQIEKGVKSQLAAEKSKMEKTIRDQLETESKEQIKSLEEELDIKSKQVIELNKTKAEVTKLKREKEELRDTIILEKEEEFSEKIKAEQIRIQKQVEESNSMKFKELEKQLDDQKKLAEEMKRKAEQGSMQLQGEVQELALEELLAILFPFDEISEVSKGIKGADVIHRVMDKLGNVCGTIIYESKRTKAFSNDWINKLKKDAVETKADISIIVTEALPDGMDKIGQKDGVWVCTFNDIKSVVLVVRDSLIKISEAKTSQTNKGEKMQMLYDYLTSNEFSLQVGAIVEGFNELHNNYIQERRSMERIWKQREKQLEKVLLNTNHFIGSIKGIAGSSLPQLDQIDSQSNLLDVIE